jgi:hypothetical protein
MKRRDFLAGVGAMAALSCVPTAGLAMPKKVRITCGIQGYPWEAEIETITRGNIREIVTTISPDCQGTWMISDSWHQNCEGICMKTIPFCSDQGALEFANLLAKQWHIINFENTTNIIKVYEGEELREKWELRSVFYPRFYACGHCECVLLSDSISRIDSKYF